MASCPWARIIDGGITGFQSISSSPLTARVIGGTQDNGAEMWVGSRVWQHVDDGDSAFYPPFSHDPQSPHADGGDQGRRF
jgi:hypothetical protein